MSDILVTGHLGYIGTRLTRLLIEQGFSVVGTDIDLYERCTFHGQLPAVANLGKDIRDIEPVDLRGISTIIHLAALSNDPLGDFDPTLTNAINRDAATRLAEMARECGVERFVFASSCSNYGASPEAMIDEDSPFNPVTAYARSKVEADLQISGMRTPSFSPIILRAGTAYGDSPRLRFDLVVNNLTAWARATGRVLLKSRGTSWRPLVHVDDICRAYLGVVVTDRTHLQGAVLNVGTSEANYRICDVAEIVASIVPDCSVKFAQGVEVDQRTYRVSCDRFKQLLPDFVPTWTLEEGVRQLDQLFAKHSLTADEIEGPRFARLPHLQWLVESGQLDSSLRRRVA